jgi:hypothetical protein
MDSSMSAEEARGHAEAAVALLTSTSSSRVKRAAAHPAVDFLSDTFAEATRRSFGPEYVSDAVGSGDAAAAVRSVYEQHRDDLNVRLRDLAAGSTRVQSVRWELAHSLGDRVTVPTQPTRSLAEARIAIETPTGTVAFQCTTEQLHELAHELRSAVRSIERVAKQ